MVALPSLSSTSRTQPARPGQPIALPQRPPRDSAAWPSLAPDNTHPSQAATSYPTSPSVEQQPPAQPAQQQPDDDEAAASEEAAAYSPLLKDHVFALYCAGQRSPAIAAQLGISERTVRHWVRATLQQLAQDDVTASPDAARQQRALAIESQRAASASAWTTYHRLTAAHNHLLDLALMHAMRQPDPAADAPQADVAAVVPDPQRLFITAQRLASSAARYLALVISANREIAHLQGQATAQDARERHATAARDAADARQLEADLIRAFTTPILPPEPAPRPLPRYDLQPAHDIAAPRTLPTTTGAPTGAALNPNTDPAALIAALRSSLQDGPTSVGALATVPASAPRAPQRGLTAKTAQPLHPSAAPTSPAPRTIQPALPAKTPKMAAPLAVTQPSTQSETAAKTATPSIPRDTMLATARPDPSTQMRQSAKPTLRATPKTSKTSKTSKPRHPASANRNKPQLILPPKP